MKLLTQILLIIVIFFTSGNLLSADSLFTVNNILLENKKNISINQLANQAIIKAYNQLTKRILLKGDIKKLNNINFKEIKGFVSFYNILENSDDGLDNINFSVTFDKDKLHDLFYSRGISYSEVNDKDFYILPILSTNSNIFIFSNNYFYKNWNNVEENTLLEFILPLENLEIIQNINRSKNNLLDLEIGNLLQEYENKNVAIAIIENENNDSEKIYIKTRIQNKIISKSLTLKREKLEKTDFNDKIIYEIKDELVNLVKSQNLIDIRTPSFLNVKLKLDKDNNLVLLNSKIDKIDLIENIFIQEFNNDYVKLKIKYLGKLEKIIDQLQNQNINLQLVNEQWVIKIS